jgi:hypothetical protein
MEQSMIMSLDEDQRSCEIVASSLSESFRNSSPYDISDGTKLSDFLSIHGLLLTMCWPLSCTLPLGTKFISGSWVNGRMGANHVIPTQTGIGLVLDPTVVDIDCLYPTDASTLGRDKNGCGPIQMDPVYGSKGAASIKNPVARQMTRKYITDFKVLNFGSETPWEDIDCYKFFSFALSYASLETWEFGEIFGIPSFQSELSMLQKQFEAFMGHPVCKLPPAEKLYALTYSGHMSWPKEKFQHAMDLQTELIQNTTYPYPIWNEFVIGLPIELKTIVQGIFYLNDNSEDNNIIAKRRAIAHEQAKIMGEKFVFKYNVEKAFVGGDLLECDTDTSGASSSTTFRPKNESLASFDSDAFMRKIWFDLLLPDIENSGEEEER